MQMPSKPAKTERQDFIQAGGTQPTPVTPPADEKEISGFSLRLYTTLLRELTDIRDARRAEAKANKRPNASAISVHSLILEGIDLLVKQEARRTKRGTAGSTTKPTKRRTTDSTE
jgi:hypothetical protein